MPALTAFAAALALGCARSDGPSDDGASADSSTTMMSSSAGASTDDDIGSTEASTSSGVAWDCDPVVLGSYQQCPENGSGICGVGGACLEAFSVEGGRVCTIIGCVDRCDCYAPPATGTATVECMEGVVANDTACILHCGNGEQCPDGMECSVQTCVWPPA